DLYFYTSFIFYFSDNLRTVCCIPHSRSGASLHVFYFIYIKKQLIALHGLDHLFNFIGRDLTLIKNFKAKPQWSTNKCCLDKFGVALWSHYYIGNKKSCCVASNINCCQSQRLRVFGFFYKDIYRSPPDCGSFFYLC